MAVGVERFVPMSGQNPMSTPLQIRDALLTGIDREYNVVDRGIVIQALSQLENTIISREVLELTRLGKHINELRRKTQDKAVASRARQLVKKWRALFVSTSTPHVGEPQPNGLKVLPSSKIVSKNSGLVIQPGGSSQLSSSAKSSSLCPPSDKKIVSGLPQPTTPLKDTDDELCTNRNKRKLHSVVERPSKHARKSLVVSSTSNGCSPIVAGYARCDNSTVKTEPKKRSGQRKKEPPLQDDVLKQQMRSALQHNKVRTTQEIVDQLSRRYAQEAAMLNNIKKSDDILNSSETKTELMDRFFESQSNFPQNSLSSTSDSSSSNSSLSSSAAPSAITSRSQTPLVPSKITAQDILSRLPDIDVNKILSDISNGFEPGIVKRSPSIDLDPQSVEMELHDRQEECINGNFNHLGEFCGWHQTVTKVTSQGQILNVLPYCVVDMI